nr:hypothetical protein [Tanacetum cinerariifolium]
VAAKRLPHRLHGRGDVDNFLARGKQRAAEEERRGQQRGVGHVLRLALERALLGYLQAGIGGGGVTSFSSCHARLREGVISRQPKGPEVLYAHPLKTKIGGRAGVNGLINNDSCIISRLHRTRIWVVFQRVRQGVLDGIIDVFVERAHHHLVVAGPKKLVAQVQVLGLGVQQIGVAGLGVDVAFAHAARVVVGRQLKKAGPADAGEVRGAHILAGRKGVAQVQAGQPVGVQLPAFVGKLRVGQAGEVLLVGVLHAHAAQHLPRAAHQAQLAVAGRYFFGGRVVVIA